MMEGHLMAAIVAGAAAVFASAVVVVVGRWPPSAQRHEPPESVNTQLGQVSETQRLLEARHPSWTIGGRSIVDEHEGGSLLDPVVDGRSSVEGGKKGEDVRSQPGTELDPRGR